VGIWTVEADGTVLQLFPNAGEQDHKFRKGEERVVPRQAKIEAVASAGIDHVWVQASRRFWEPVEGQRQGPFSWFKTERDRAALAGLQRGLRVRENLSEKILKYQVGPR
jgi:hypothetical protein